jgi:hypothetical protein
VAVALGALPGLAVMSGFLADPQLMYNQPDGHSALFTAWAARLGGDWPKIIPSFQFYAPSPPFLRASWSLALVWAVVVAFLSSLLRPRGGPNPAAPERDPGLGREAAP